MSVSVDNNEAYSVAIKAIEEARNNDNPHSAKDSEIAKLISGEHLTYRYILVTGLLSKATNNQVNPLCLQASAEVQGAYDARSVCHGVIVEMGIDSKELSGKLGASNEPFLNKPARYKLHDSSNAVRKGKDKDLQLTSIDILASATSSELAFDMLVDSFRHALKRPSKTIQRSGEAVFDFNSFVDECLQRSSEGEVCAILTASAMEMCGTMQNWKVKAHPVNQAGTSSNEILDIDIYDGKTPVLSIEVKDKAFNKSDVEHAANKAAEYGVETVIFAKGPQAVLQQGSEAEITGEIANNGCKLLFIPVSELVKSCYVLAGSPPEEPVIDMINAHIKSTRAKDATVSHFQSLFD